MVLYPALSQNLLDNKLLDHFIVRDALNGYWILEEICVGDDCKPAHCEGMYIDPYTRMHTDTVGWHLWGRTKYAIDSVNSGCKWVTLKEGDIFHLHEEMRIGGSKYHILLKQDTTVHRLDLTFLSEENMVFKKYPYGTTTSLGDYYFRRPTGKELKIK